MQLLYRDCETTGANHDSVCDLNSPVSKIEKALSADIFEVAPDKNWPNAGKIEFRNVVFRYQPGGALVIRDISFCIREGEKIGIVGRTVSICLDSHIGDIFIIRLNTNFITGFRKV